MHSRRDFVRSALSGAAGFLAFSASGDASALTESIRRALAIAPAEGSTFLDAQHIVVLMQENRSFDHCFGALRGVRGFSDPRAMRLATGLPVWAQTRNPAAPVEHFIPFRFDIKRSKITWMGSLPHGWTDQTDARAHGRMDGWLAAKTPGDRQFAHMPLTLGFYTRADLPFYYALADAFTICDQHFCSSLTGTTPNRNYLWTGKTRESRDTPGLVRNEDVDFGREAHWSTFPERLEDLGVSWKIYQNEICLSTGLSGEEDAWLSNFSDNPIEWFAAFSVRFHPKRREFVARRIAELPAEISAAADAATKARATNTDPKSLKKLTDRESNLRNELTDLTAERAEYTDERWDKLSPRGKSLHQRAFTVNAADPGYRTLTKFTYEENGHQRSLEVPAGDVLHQFRRDVESGALPTVSWLVPPERFSDHPSSAWYGAWFLSEAMNILTKNPDLWRKTIFILTYDENDGYFDHVTPFVAPRPGHPETGKASAGIDTTDEYVELESDLKRKPPSTARGGPIGLGFRVPMVIASPWSRGGAVCSQVFDHTSVIQLMELILSRKLGKPVKETNISDWRRAVCGDLSSAFRAADLTQPLPTFLERDAVLRDIHAAQFQAAPAGFRPLTAEELSRFKSGSIDAMPVQEPGSRESCPLPYELAVNAATENGRITLTFEAGNTRFGKAAAGAPFIAHAIRKPGDLQVRDYAVAAGATVDDSWPLAEFENGKPSLRVHGPNGFYREFTGAISIDLKVRPDPVKPALRLIAANLGPRAERLTLTDRSYGRASATHDLAPGARIDLEIPMLDASGWYDFAIRAASDPDFTAIYAGRHETGAWSVNDPLIGREATLKSKDPARRRV